MKRLSAILHALLWTLAVLVGNAAAQNVAAPVLTLRTLAQVDSTGVRLSHLVTALPEGLADVRLAAAPQLGAGKIWTREEILALLQQASPEVSLTNWSGARKIRVTRRLRPLHEAELKQWLTSRLQKEFVKDRGELDLRFTRPWKTVQVPDEPLELEIVDLPASGVTPNCIVRFELLAGDESAGTWQVAVQARVWREVWVAGSALMRGQLASEAHLTLERRDVLTLRDALGEGDVDTSNPYLEIAGGLQAGMPLRSRSFRLRPIIRRGQIVDAIVSEGVMLLSVKVEALQDGLPGQTVRVRNLTSKREFRGEVKNEDTIEIAL